MTFIKRIETKENVDDSSRRVARTNPPPHSPKNSSIS